MVDFESSLAPWTSFVVRCVGLCWSLVFGLWPTVWSLVWFVDQIMDHHRVGSPSKLPWLHNGASHNGCRKCRILEITRLALQATKKEYVAVAPGVLHVGRLHPELDGTRWRK